MANDQENSKNALAVQSTSEILDLEANEILNQIVTTTDIDKQKRNIALFNQSQQKKTMVRMNKLNKILDLATDEVTDRLVSHPEEFDTKQLVDTMKITQDLMTKSQEMITAQEDVQPTLINITDNSTEIHVDSSIDTMDRNKRKRVDDVLSAILGQINKPKQDTYIDTNVTEISDENK